VSPSAPPILHVCHIVTADLWGGAEVQVATAADRVVLRWFADRVVAVSARPAESLRHSWVWGGPIAQIHNGVNLGTVRAARTPLEVRLTLSNGRDELIVGTAGRLSRVKGHEYLLRAAALILEQEPRSSQTIGS